MLQSLYKFRAPSGDKVNPEDIMVIAPYRGSGTWSKIPSVISACENPKSLGFNADRNRLNLPLVGLKESLSLLGALKMGPKDGIEGWDRQVHDWMMRRRFEG
ncbi:hypothetical protein N7509_011731 [Penicillium cosmopolitanum]|uniref:Uncharacterized protein n=1 Tax=Penicillium cosmopolitanum TaxID=1131564 RepID=A0A9W9VE40_9EURO|nr:uncharacterized protein N7509_011731 [Penicillium cosmopolitanum]KAJ5378612.1 hypothetical protein N7509_011731 [Penicillium cosmopolitanum]